MGAISFIIPFTSFRNIPLLLHFGRLHHHRHHRADVISRRAGLRGHFLQRRPSTPRLGLRACIVSRFGCDSRNRGGDLGLGGWLGELGKKERGTATWLDLPALCSDLSTIPRLGEQLQGGRKELGMRTRPNWLLDTCPNQ